MLGQIPAQEPGLERILVDVALSEPSRDRERTLVSFDLSGRVLSVSRIVQSLLDRMKKVATPRGDFHEFVITKRTRRKFVRGKLWPLLHNVT